MKAGLLTLLVAAGLLGAPATASAAGPVVRTDAGPVRGTAEAGYRTFQGVPFAAPPVGPRRWRPPAAVQPWTAPRDATKPGIRCAQTAGAGKPSELEDCLYLTVTAPDAPSRRPRPVLVWLHGGGNTYGTASDFDTHRLAVGGDVVVVSPNYRLSLFSNFGHPALAGAGDFGLLDQQAALRWVKRNAAAFGGDPGNVTLIGESGGAFDVCGQLTSPSAQGLFQRAILHSGSCSTSWPANGMTDTLAAPLAPWRSKAEADTSGVALAAAHGCTDPATAVDCLRRVPAADLLAGVPVNVPITPLAYGTPTLPQRPDRALADGNFHRVPVLTGTTHDEARLTTGFIGRAFGPAEYHEQLVTSYGTRAAAIEARYPVSAYPSAKLAWSAVLTDSSWTCPQLADAASMARRTPVHAFEFADPQAPPGYFPFPADFPPGAFHSSDMAYLFDVADFPVSFTPAQQRLADTMIRSWAAFARSGQAAWPRVPAAMVVKPDASEVAEPAREHQCGFWLRGA
ncbi:carboxylesterase/lipase family protein [Amycolatopsis sp. NPDC051758]|uniref:carboxylesterase/lipase family protein n=1 Tax=Amycolatopsis sp. NPDC051758 TaxID=3363935 RepID=UPI00378D4B18